ncbi:MAG: ABC transporter ATP-binding protein [Clostridia bacterium]|jgi:ATP-binding cassette subfamily B protein
MIIEKRTYGIADILRIPLKCAPILTVLAVVQNLADGIVPTVQVLVTASFLDTAIRIVGGALDPSLIYPSLGGVVALIAYTWVSEALARFAKVRMELSIRERFRTAISDKRARLAYCHIENHDTWDLISRVSKTPETQLQTALYDLLSLSAGILRVAGLLVLLITQVWWAALLILVFSVPLFALAVRSGKANYQASREVTKYRRKTDYLTEVLTGREAVDERSLFGYGDRMNESWYEQYETARKIELRTKRKWYIKMKAGVILTALISILIVLVLLQPVLSGVLSLGMFISLVNAVFGLVQAMSWNFTYLVDQLARHREYMKDLTDFAALEESKGALELPAAPPPLFESLELDRVRFRYPGTDRYILDGLSLRIEAGKHYAFVGINGAGKTTITKLITGLYDNYEGRILLNGKELSQYRQEELKAFFSVVYQDFARYHIPLKDNIALGRAGSLEDEGMDRSIQEAMERVNLQEMPRKLPQGLHTPLGKIRQEGQDVSGGEWQRIAMARAVLNPAPIRILDEPTAALDPISESRLYEEFEEISRDKATLFISHRLGSTKLADEILVIGDGRVVEKGSHQELMEAGGVYAEMYEKQRSWYL